MKEFYRFSKRVTRSFLIPLSSILVFLLWLVFPSCQKSEKDLLPDELPNGQSIEKCFELPGNGASLKGFKIYFGPKQFKRAHGSPDVVKLTIQGSDFNCYDGTFVLKIQNGGSKSTRVSSAEIKIDGVVIAGPSDFSKNISTITKSFLGLKPGSVLKVKLNGAPGSFINVWIMGKLKLINPVFTQIGPLYQNSVAPELPIISINGIKGKWTPLSISTATAGITDYTFTPDEGQCASDTIMKIEVLPTSGVVYDVEGNIYKTEKIGNQLWMAENLKSTKYNNGDLIGTTMPANLNIAGEITPKYQWAYAGNESNVATYGRLYTLYAVTDSRGLCPVGWHLPSDAEWTTLTNYLTNNGFGYGGSGTGIGKSLAAKYGWSTNGTPGNIGNDQNSNNSSGFSALPAGYRIYNGFFQLIGSYASWWSSTDASPSQVWIRILETNVSTVKKVASVKQQGGAVRCIRD